MKVIGFEKLSKKACVNLSFILLAVLALPTLGQTGGDYELVWSTIDGGGSTISGGDFTLRGTIGQPDAGEMTGADYELSGGFLPGVPICIVDFEHFAIFAEHWLDGPCDAGNNWCGGADLNYLDGVDLVDLNLLADEWLYCCPDNWLLK